MEASAIILDITGERNPLTFPAWLGHRVDPRTKAFVWAVCAWGCEGREQIEAEARRIGASVSHGICPSHARELICSRVGSE